MARATSFVAGLAVLLGAALFVTRPAATQRADPPATAKAGKSRADEPAPSQPEPVCDLAGDAAIFMEALQSFRAGDQAALARLNGSAERLERGCERSDPARVAAFYQSLTQEERDRGLQLEAQFDVLHAAAADRPAELREDLAAFLRLTDGLADLPVRAHALSLDARLGVRLLEQPERSDRSARDGREVEGVKAAASEALALFQQAGQITPTLDPLWTLARCALLSSDWDQAEHYFSELEDRAYRVGRDSWRERGLLGLVGLERERGALFAIDGLLEDLASFRDPKQSWALAREVAVSQVQRSQAEDAFDWLDMHPPNENDPELLGGTRFAKALDEWRSLMTTAELQSGKTGRSQDRLASVRESSDAEPAASDLAVLTQAWIQLESEAPLQSLELVRSLPSEGARAVDLMDRWTLEGRALLALGRTSEAIERLERALGLARAPHPPGDAVAVDRGTTLGVQGGSRIGEWLGLSAIECLGRAYVEGGDPLRAAVLFEWVHAPGLSRAECEAEVLRLCAASTMGYVTWMVGADSTLAVHVAPSGAAEAMAVPVGRRGLERGVQRLRDALQHSHAGGARDPEWQAAAHELCQALLPASAWRHVDRTSLILSPHGVLERLPFEALICDSGEPPLGVGTALTVVPSLRAAWDLAPPLDGRSADWIALGAPATERFDELPGARRELLRIGQMQPSWTARLGEEMTRRALESALQSGRPLHLATHVAPLPGTGARSIAPMGFVVAGDDMVSAGEVRALAPQLPLAVLTACGSAEGVTVDGLSVRGMAQVMLEAGTRAAVVTLWPIEDRAGERASVRLHAALLGGATPAEATRRAREFLWLLDEPPSQWAAYRLLE